MNDLISRQAAIDALGDAHFKNYGNAIMVIQALPSAEPVKHEECEYVISKGKAGYHEEYKCSVCGDSFYWTQNRSFQRRFNYCRNCGRKIIRFIEKEVNTVSRESE